MGEVGRWLLIAFPREIDEEVVERLDPDRDLVTKFDPTPGTPPEGFEELLSLLFLLFILSIEPIAGI